MSDQPPRKDVIADAPGDPLDAALAVAFAAAWDGERPTTIPDAGSTVELPVLLGPEEAASARGTPGLGSGRYEVLGEVARGGMGVLLQGRDSHFGRDVAFKVLREEHCDNPTLRQRFLEEARIAGQLQHPGIAPVYELGRCGDRRPCFTMKLVRGRTLADLLRERPSTGHDMTRFLRIFEQVCQTVAYAHSKGVVHRDLKPANVMVGEFGEVQVMDWGLAKVLGRPAADATGAAEPLRPVRGREDESQPGTVLGTPAYMAPEQARGEGGRLDERCDVFALGAILYEILTGRPPHGDGPAQGEGMVDWFVRVQTGRAVPPRRVNGKAPPGLEAVCLKATAARPEDRYGSARELAADVGRWLADEPVAAWREPWSERAARWLRRHRTWFRAGLAALFLVSLVSLVSAVLVEHARRAESAEKDRADAEAGEAGRQREAALAAEAARLREEARADRTTQRALRRWPPALADEKTLAALTEAPFGSPVDPALLARYPDDEVYREQLLSLVDLAEPTGFSGGWERVLRPALGPLARADWKHQPPTSEEVWLAQESVWVVGSLVRAVKDVNDALTVFPAAEGGTDQPPGEWRFSTPGWQLDLRLGKDGSGAAVLGGRIKNLSESSRPAPERLRLRLHRSRAGEPFDLTLPSAAVEPGRTLDVPDRVLPEAAADAEGVFRVRQVFTRQSAPIREIREVRMGQSPARMRLLVPWRAAGFGPGDPGPETPNGLRRARYLKITPSRRIFPVAFVLVVDQESLGRVLESLVKSEMLLQVTQTQFSRVPQPAGPEGQRNDVELVVYANVTLYN